MKKEAELDTQNYVSELYEKQRYQKPYARYYHDWWTRKMLSFVSCKGRILDNGCGIGILFEALPGHNIMGLDLSQRMLQKAKNRSSKLIRGDSQDLPFKDKSFDLVFARSLLHHLSNPIKATKEMARVLRSNGEIVIVDTNRSILSFLPRKLASKTRHFSENHNNFHRNEIVKILSSKFKIESVYFFGYIAYPLLGFPDLIDFFKYVPMGTFFVRLLIIIDEAISRIPLIREQGWGILIKGKKI